GTSRRSTQHLVRPEPGHAGFDLRHYGGREACGKAGRLALLAGRPDPGLAADRCSIQGRASPKRGQALPRVAAREGATGEYGHLVGAYRRAAATSLSADL